VYVTAGEQVSDLVVRTVETKLIVALADTLPETTTEALTTPEELAAAMLLLLGLGKAPGQYA
jgi:hypothetical protein